MAFPQHLQQAIDGLNAEINDQDGALGSARLVLQGAHAQKAVLEAKGMQKYYDFPGRGPGVVSRFRAIVRDLPQVERGGDIFYKMPDGRELLEYQLWSRRHFP